MTQVLNIDAFKEETPLIATIGGVEHRMAPTSVQTFLDNLADLEALAEAPDIKAEINLTVRMICRAFPTLTEDEVKSWPLHAIEKLFNSVRGHEGETSVEETDAAGNEKAAS